MQREVSGDRTIGRLRGTLGRVGRAPRVAGVAGTVVAALLLVPSAPAGAASTVSVVDPGTTFTGVVVAGSNVWAYAQGTCGTNPPMSYLDEFTLSGQLVKSIGVGPAAVPCAWSEPITTDGTSVAVLNGPMVTVAGAVNNTYLVPDPNLFSPFPEPFPMASLAISGTTLVVVDWASESYGVDLTSGGLLWNDPPTCGLVAGVTADQGDLVMLCAAGGSVTLDASTGTPAIAGPVSLPPVNPGASIVSQGGYAYYTTGSSDPVYRMDVPDLAPSGEAVVSGAGSLGPIGIVGSNLWVADQGSPTLWPVDIVSGMPGAPVTLPDTATSVAGGGNTVWAALANGGLAEFTVPPSTPTLRASTVSLGAPSGASPVVGTPTTLTATVSTPGAVSFYDGSSAIPGCVGLAATTTVSCSWSPTTVGSRSLSATLTPTDPTYLHSTSAVVTLSVAPQATTVSAGFGSTPMALGHVSLPATGSVPGTLTFSVGGSFITGCVGLAAPDGSATCHGSLGAGSHQITVALAPYSANDAPSSVTQGVKVGPRELIGFVPFARGSSALDRAGRAALARLVATLSADGYSVVRLFGLSDEPRPASLARDRAATVAAVLRHDLSGVDVISGIVRHPGSHVVLIANL